MQNKSKIFMLTGLIIVLCAIMAVVDGIFQANYIVKSLIKLVLFLGAPFVYGMSEKAFSFKKIFVPPKKGMLVSLLLGAGVYAVILGGYLLLKDVFDFSAITGTLTEGIGVNKGNFVFVALYISFVNSLLEEFFFRGFAFLTLKNIASRKTAYIFSALAFSAYHVAMMTGWFSIPLFALVLIGLFAGGLIFNFLNEKTGTIYPSWLVHMFANFAINTVGFILFGII